ncbi:MAG: response regulator transcription factor [Dehalococcoidales bacterium]|nr:response regulator transcription factor [Dehalococcoidales bacterium]
MSGRKVLVVDDDAKTVELVKLYLARDGYKVFTAAEGNEALAMARQLHPDLMVLDLMLPGMSGLDICRTIKNEFDVLVIMLTARTTEEDKLTGLGLGADDYVTKPFSPRELAARVRAVLRRLPEEAMLRGPAEIRRGDLTINFPNREVSIGGKSIKLTPIEFKILGVMARDPGRVFSREQLIEMVFGYDFEGFDRTVDVHILNLRRKLDAESKQIHYIKTVYGAGYKFDGSEK